MDYVLDTCLVLDLLEEKRRYSRVEFNYDLVFSLLAGTQALITPFTFAELWCQKKANAPDFQILPFCKTEVLSYGNVCFNPENPYACVLGAKRKSFEEMTKIIELVCFAAISKCDVDLEESNNYVNNCVRKWLCGKNLDADKAWVLFNKKTSYALMEEILESFAEKYQPGSNYLDQISPEPFGSFIYRDIDPLLLKYARWISKYIKEKRINGATKIEFAFGIVDFLNAIPALRQADEYRVISTDKELNRFLYANGNKGNKQFIMSLWKDPTAIVND